MRKATFGGATFALVRRQVPTDTRTHTHTHKRNDELFLFMTRLGAFALTRSRARPPVQLKVSRAHHHSLTYERARVHERLEIKRPHALIGPEVCADLSARTILFSDSILTLPFGTAST